MVGSQSLLKPKTNIDLHVVDAVWSHNHDAAVILRDRNPKAGHIFISEMCDVAVEEYATVCRLLKVKHIIVIGTTHKFLTESKKLLNIPGVIVSTLHGLNI